MRYAHRRMYGRRWIIRGLGTTGALAVSSAWVGKVHASPKATLSVQPVDVEHGEDGSGRTLKSAAPHALVLESDAGWLVRAVDPVLHIGDLHFHSYEHTGRRTLQFVVDDVSRLTPGLAVYVQYGEDERSRIRLAELEKTW